MCTKSSVSPAFPYSSRLADSLRGFSKGARLYSNSVTTIEVEHKQIFLHSRPPHVRYPVDFLVRTQDRPETTVHCRRQVFEGLFRAKDRFLQGSGAGGENEALVGRWHHAGIKEEMGSADRMGMAAVWKASEEMETCESCFPVALEYFPSLS